MFHDWILAICVLDSERFLKAKGYWKWSSIVEGWRTSSWFCWSGLGYRRRQMSYLHSSRTYHQRTHDLGNDCASTKPMLWNKMESWSWVRKCAAPSLLCHCKVPFLNAGISQRCYGSWWSNRWWRTIQLRYRWCQHICWSHSYRKWICCSCKSDIVFPNQQNDQRSHVIILVQQQMLDPYTQPIMVNWPLAEQLSYASISNQSHHRQNPRGLPCR